MTIGNEIGLSALMGQTMEECAELAIACSKIQRLVDKVNPPRCTWEEAIKSLEEEATDVDNCLTRIKEMGLSVFSGDVFVTKVARWEDSIIRTKGLDDHDHSGLLED